MTDKQDVIVSLLKEIDKNIENLGGSETDVLLSNRITTLENSVKTINTDINGIKTTNTTQTTNITSNTNKINTANLNITNLTNELSTVKSNVSTNASNIGTLTTDVNTLKTTSATKTELNTTKTSLNTTNANVSNLTTRVTNVENKATTNESNINTLNERVTTLENAEPSGGGGGTTSGGYPIVTVEDDFNITAEPNTFYDIRNSEDAVINVNINKNIYSTSYTNQSYYCFSGDGALAEFNMMFEIVGGTITADTSLEGFKYKLLMPCAFVMGQDLDWWLSDVPVNGATIQMFTILDGENITYSMSNIVVKDIGEHIIFASIDDVDMGISAQLSIHTIKEIENDREDYKHKYSIGGLLSLMQLEYSDDGAYMYTNTPYTEATEAMILISGCSGAVLEMVLSITVEKVQTTVYNDLSSINEFVFSFNSPTSINFNQVINWNNENVPDLTKQGQYTISIVNSVGCYTFI